ncbi:hypothetical protein FQN57_006060 [Myotisia sp. PD_48]|nr:hypothetical protein FQN57_006060 [Myotisia sp. PD_48]
MDDLDPDLPILNEYKAPDLPNDIPTGRELLNLCTEVDGYMHRSCQPFPRDNPKYWLKYGQSVCWHEVPAHNMAYHGLQEIVLGKTGAQLLEEAKDEASKAVIYRKMSYALQELTRIPVPQDSPPVATDGGLFRHMMFWDTGMSDRHYQNVDQLEQHLNLKKPDARPDLKGCRVSQWSFATPIATTIISSLMGIKSLWSILLSQVFFHPASPSIASTSTLKDVVNWIGPGRRSLSPTDQKTEGYEWSRRKIQHDWEQRLRHEPPKKPKPEIDYTNLPLPPIPPPPGPYNRSLQPYPKGWMTVPTEQLS